jgi:hypothetical protein
MTKPDQPQAPKPDPFFRIPADGTWNACIGPQGNEEILDRMEFVRAVTLKTTACGRCETFKAEVAGCSNDVLVSVGRKLLLEYLLAEALPAVAIEGAIGSVVHGGVEVRDYRAVRSEEAHTTSSLRTGDFVFRLVL